MHEIKYITKIVIFYVDIISFIISIVNKYDKRMFV